MKQKSKNNISCLKILFMYVAWKFMVCDDENYENSSMVSYP